MQTPRLTHLASLAVVAALIAVLLAGCGAGSPSSSTGDASTGSASFQANLAYAQCMRAHGLARFPNPSRSQGFSFGGELSANPNSPAARANDACKHLLSQPARERAAPRRRRRAALLVRWRLTADLQAAVLHTFTAPGCLRYPAAAGSRDHRPRTDRRPVGVPSNHGRILVVGYRRPGAGVFRHPERPGTI